MEHELTEVTEFDGGRRERRLADDGRAGSLNSCAATAVLRICTVVVLEMWLAGFNNYFWPSWNARLGHVKKEAERTFN